MKKLILISLLCTFISNFSFAQSNEGHLFEITSRVKIFYNQQDPANLSGTHRYIHIGIMGNRTDVDDLVGYMDRFAVEDKDMISSVEPTSTLNMVDYYKFYLNPLYDANNFQLMLKMYQLKTFFIGNDEHPVTDFSNTIYASIKTKNR